LLIYSRTDQSIEALDGDYAQQIRNGTLRQLVEASRSQSSPILNALSFPLGLSGAQPSSFSSEIEAWRLTKGLKFCPPELQFPVGELRWGLAATEGGRHWMHVDSDGLGTFIDVKTGLKMWIVFSPPSAHSPHRFASIDTFLDGFDTNGVVGGRWDIDSRMIDSDNDDRWIAEAVCLGKDTRL
jgi:hypothetical protein